MKDYLNCLDKFFIYLMVNVDNKYVLFISKKIINKSIRFNYNGKLFFLQKNYINKFFINRRQTSL